MIGLTIYSCTFQDVSIIDLDQNLPKPEIHRTSPQTMEKDAFNLTQDLSPPLDMTQVNLDQDLISEDLEPILDLRDMMNDMTINDLAVVSQHDMD